MSLNYSSSVSSDVMPIKCECKFCAMSSSLEQSSSSSPQSSSASSSNTPKPSSSSPSSLLCPDSPNAGESDADSGIVAASKGQRIGSTSSNSDEDHGHEISTSVPNGNRIQSMNFHRVRFDDELHLSEHNMRRSCRKLFQALYTPQTQQSQTIQRNHHHHQPIIKQSSGNRYNHYNNQKSNYSVGYCNTDSNCSLLPACHCHQFSQTLPRKWQNQHAPNNNRPVGGGITSHRINSEINLNDDHDQSIASQFEGLLLQTVSHTNDKNTNNNNTIDPQSPEIKQMKLLHPSRFKSKSCWSITSRNDFTSVSCAALDRINSMTDPFESASMVHAFAKPIVISAKDRKIYETNQRIIDEPIYETIYPKDDNEKLVSVNNQLHNNDKVKKTELSENELIKSKKVTKDDCFKSDKKNNNKIDDTKKETTNKTDVNKCSLSCSLSTIPQLGRSHSAAVSPNKFQRKSILRNSSSLKPNASKSSKYGLSPDEIYPNENDNDDDGIHKSYVSDDSDEEIEKVEYATVKKQPKSGLKRAQDKFSYSYSAGDIAPKHSNKETLTTQSELNLHEIGQSVTLDNRSPKKSLFQRFRSVLTRAFTTDKIYKPEKDSIKCTSLASLNKSPTRSRSDLRVDFNSNDTSSTANINKSPSFVKSIKTRMSFKRNVKVNVEKNSHEKRLRWKDQSSSPDTSPSVNKVASLVWGELIKLNSNGSQNVQIHRQKGNPFGFFVARGTVNNVKGVFVSRMRDEEIQKSLMGVLEIGDEILSIDGESVKESNIMHVNELIANKEKIILTVVPYVNSQKYI